MIFLTLLIPIALGLTCDSHCKSSGKGDGYCDLSCNNPACHYDAPTSATGNAKAIFANSDCYSDCMLVCPENKLADGSCNSACNTKECAWDLGDCSYCADGCET